MTINERFFKLLDEKKVSQKDFCESTGIPKQTVSGWKSRKTDPPAHDFAICSESSCIFPILLDII